MLKRQGISLNRKKLYRLYKEERLSVRKRGGANGHWACGRQWRSRRVAICPVLSHVASALRAARASPPQTSNFPHSPNTIGFAQRLSYRTMTSAYNYGHRKCDDCGEVPDRTWPRDRAGTQRSAKQTRVHQICRCGRLNTALSFATYCLGIILGLNYEVANSAAWLTGVVVGFYLNSRFVFRKLGGYTRLLVFFCINVTTLVTSITLLALLIEVFGLNAIVASLITTPIMVVISYLNTKFVVFR
jgi:putative flippase GtrA